MKTFYTLCILLGGIIFMSYNYAGEKNRPNGNLRNRKVQMNTAQNKETVRRLYEDCLNKRNYALMPEIIAADFTGEGNTVGPEGFEHTIKPLVGSFPDILWKVEDLVAEGDEVVVRHSWTGTQKGVYHGIAASSKSVTNEGMVIFQFKDNKIVHAWVQTDRLGFLQQLGVVPVDLFANAPKK
jgi:predicted ester cyclase